MCLVSGHAMQFIYCIRKVELLQYVAIALIMAGFVGLCIVLNWLVSSMGELKKAAQDMTQSASSQYVQKRVSEVDE